ncbi:hypothetical protein [Anaeromyxobacter oryzae]|uniref:Uncharacterized protein n=1 Tax=Anaeromyxobacter oryzae TaxID=2918170 RepID=A0ABN6MY46_9BACT|nr:hypothetical protein [Anaeromyxobacter oryzae]BDG05170.1 hypothetical protein AMOR_41660 [Anaeromyxobacter oryzae]
MMFAELVPALNHSCGGKTKKTKKTKSCKTKTKTRTRKHGGGCR